MSQANELLNSLTEEEIAAYSANPETEEMIIIGDDRFITVPDSLKKIAVQYDHNVETVTFSCPRYWDGVDMLHKTVYINYMRADGVRDTYHVPFVDEAEEESRMIFTWTLSKNATMVKGMLSFLVCINETDWEGKEIFHWNSELNREMYVSEGLECKESILLDYPDIITDLLTRMDEAEEVVQNVPKVIDNTWWVYDANARKYVDTGASAVGVGIGHIYSQPTSDGTGTYIKFDGTNGTYLGDVTIPNGEKGKDGKSGLPDRYTHHNLSSNPSIFNNTHNEFTYDSDFTSGSLALFIELFNDSDVGLSDTSKSSAATITVNVVDGLTIEFYLYDKNGEGDWSGDKMSLVWSGAEPTFTPGYTYFLSFVPISDTRILGAWSEVPTV
jgi:hypothetical protein